MNEILYIFTFLTSLLITIYGTPIIKNVAKRYNILDYPDGNLKKHREPIPYMGGIIVYFASISPISLIFDFNKEILGIMFAGSILLIVGLFDDLKALNPQTKFFFQIIATYILIKSGIFIDLSFLPVWLNSFLSFLWILTLINAFNIIDILDGFSSSIALINLITIFIISLYNNNFVISILSLSFAASLGGFLYFNWEPAKIYLGDAGSMLIGMIVGSLTIMGSYTIFNDYAFISGFLIPSIAVFDLIYVIIIRLIKGKSPFLGSPDHFALRLKKRFNLNASKTVLIILFFQLFLSAIVILNFYTNPITTIITTIFIIFFYTFIGFYLYKVDMK